MRVNKNVRQQMAENLTGERAQSCVHKAGRKTPGTRVGVLKDWRGSSTNFGKMSGAFGGSVRDGR